MKLWIDGSVGGGELAVFGMSAVERHIRAACHRQAPPAEIVIDLGDGGAPEPRLPRDLARLPIRIVRRGGPLGARLAAALEAAGGQPLLAVAGDAVIDQRLFGELAGRPGSWIVRETRQADAPFLLRLEPGMAGRLPRDAAGWAVLGAALEASGAAKPFRQEDFTAAHIAVLRRDLPFWLRPVRTEAECRAVESFMFKASYKGSTDFFTKYVYPPLVWLSVRPLARARIHPNTVTWVSIVLTFAAVPLFAAGWWVAGLLCAYGMSVLDSVDGKLARLTFTDSKLGNVLDHGLDIVHPPLWYLGWAMGLAGAGLAGAGMAGAGLGWPGPDSALWGTPPMQAALVLIVFYVLDRLVLSIYKARFGRGLHAHAPIDGLVRTFISRRNINLPLFTVGLILGLGREVFYLIAAWQVVTVLWHAGRTAWILARGERPAGLG